MPLSRRIAKALRKGQSVEINGETFISIEHMTNKHQKSAIDRYGLTSLKPGDRVVCYVYGLLEVRTIEKIKQRNYLPRFKVGKKTDDIKEWVGKTKILGVKEESFMEELVYELE